MQFELKKQKAKLGAVNVRSELHGGERLPAATLLLKIVSSNDLLSEFHPGLKSSFYERSDDVDLVTEPGQLTRLRFPDLGRLRWDGAIVGAEVVIDYGIGTLIALETCTVDGFLFELLDGGSVILTVRVQCHPTEKQFGQLAALVQSEIDLSILPPEADEPDPTQELAETA